ncbi:hypothetical protein ACLBXM_16155 [Xanthobacteraceae bacterium A53D]
MSGLRIVLGFALAPLASGVLQALVTGWLGAFGIVMFSYPLALILGIPGFLVARHLGWLGPKAVIAGGAGLGFSAAALLSLWPGLETTGFGIGAVIAGGVLLAIHGAVVAFAFWLIALSRWR